MTKCHCLALIFDWHTLAAVRYESCTFCSIVISQASKSTQTIWRCLINEERIMYLYYKYYLSHHRRMVKCNTDVRGKLKHSTPTSTVLPDGTFWIANNRSGLEMIRVWNFCPRTLVFGKICSSNLAWDWLADSANDHIFLDKVLTSLRYFSLLFFFRQKLKLQWNFSHHIETKPYDMYNKLCTYCLLFESPLEKL